MRLVCSSYVFSGTLDILFLCNPAHYSHYLHRRIFIEIALCFMSVKESFSAVSHLLWLPRITLHMLRVSLNANFHREYFRLYFDKNLIAKSGTLVRGKFILLCTNREMEHGSAGKDWENSKFKWEKEETEWNRCAVVQRAAYVRGEHTQS